MRVRIIKTTPHYKRDEIVTLEKSFALDLIKQGIAILTKDMVETDGNTK